VRGKGLDQREQRIARQIEVVLAQEEALDRRRDDLREREDRVVRGERDLEARRRAQELELSKRSAALGERERALAAREQVLAEREQALDGAARKKARDLAKEAVSLAERSSDVARREALVVAETPPPVDKSSRSLDSSSARYQDPQEPPVSVEDTAEIPLPEARVPDGGWNLDRLERLVEQHGGAFPARLDEWRYYLLYLREFADAGGNLPRPFDWLVYTEFEELLERTPTAA